MIRRIETALLAAACLIPFVRLGLGEIQPWDESLYVIRAGACLKFGAWLDQTKYAVGALYSAWHPPLGIWLIAISKTALGESTFAARFPAALAASASVLLLWLLLRRYTASSSALIGAVSLATAALFLLYSHRAQLESFLLFFSLASLLFLARALERRSLAQAILSGLFLGFALQVKLGYALYATPMLMLLPWTYGKPGGLRYSALGIGSAFVVALPWFLMMSALHPNYWSFVTQSISTFQTGSYAPSSLAWWYYANHLVVALPLIVTVVFVRRWNRMLVAALAWLLSVAIVLQVFGTRMPHFAFLLLAPGALLAGLAWDRMTELSAKWRAPLFVSAILAIAWSASEQVRLLLTNHLAWSDTFFPPVSILMICIAVVLAGFALALMKSRARFAISLSLILLGLAFAHLVSEQESIFINGAERVASLTVSLPIKSNMIVIHPDFPHELYAPQLAYYTGGWTLGWIPNKTSRTITWDSAATPAYAPDTAREIVVVVNYTDRFNHPSPAKIALWDSLMLKLQRSFSTERVFRSYVVFY